MAWKNAAYRKQFLEYLRGQFQIQELSDWYRFSRKDLVSNGGSGLFNYHSSLASVLREAYPHFPWDQASFRNSKPRHRKVATQEGLRAFFDRTATAVGVSEPSDWYKVRRVDLIGHEGGKRVLQKYDSLRKALSVAYPEYPWVASKFLQRGRRRFWLNSNNVRSFMDSLAPQFNIATPADWHHVTSAGLRRKGGKQILKYYPSVEAAVRVAYPDVNWDSSKFHSLPQTKEAKAPKIHQVSDCADVKIMQYLDNNRWRCVLPNGIRVIAKATDEFYSKWPMAEKGDIATVGYQGFVRNTRKPKRPILQLLRSDVTWDAVVNQWKEHHTSKRKHRGYWLDIDNRRRFFLELAAELQFDPTKAKNWREVQVDTILKKNASGLLGNYGNSLKKALLATFPDMQFAVKERAKSGYWQDVNNCRQFFDQFAKDYAFDPLLLENWYGIELKHLLQRPGALTIRECHGGMRTALQKAYPELSFSRWKAATKKRVEAGV